MPPVARTPTPNPATWRYHPGIALRMEGALDFDGPERAQRHPLIADLFAVPGVRGVMVASDWISVSLDDPSAWDEAEHAVQAAFARRPLDHGAFEFEFDAAAGVACAPEDAPAAARIQDLLDSRVRPAVAGDGGDVEFVGYENGVVALRLRGACAGCPSATQTLRMGIENLLRHYLPEDVAGVTQVP